MRQYRIVFSACILIALSSSVPTCGDQPPPSEAAPKELVRVITAGNDEYDIHVGGTLDGFNTARYVNLDGHHMMESAGFEPDVELILENVGEDDVVNPRILVNDRHDCSSEVRCFPGTMLRSQYGNAL